MAAPQERSLLEGFLHYLSIILKYKVLIIFITSIAAVGVVVFSVITLMLPPDKNPLPNQYRADALLLVQEETGGGMASMLSSLGLSAPAGLGGTGGFDYGQIALRVLTSRSILDSLVEEFDIIKKYEITKSVRTKSRQFITDKAEFNYDRATGALTISFEDTDPVFARDIVNRMVELLNEWFTSTGGTTRLKQKNLLEQKITDMTVDIARLESLIKEFQKKHGVLTVEELATAQTAILADLRTQLIQTDMQIKNYSQFSKIEDPVLVRLKSERDNLVDLINQIEEGYTDSGGRFMPAKRNLPDLALEFTHLTIDLQIQRRIYESLSQQYEITRLTLESEPVFQILELAEVPDEKSGPQRGQLCVITVIIAFIGSIILAFFINAINKIKKDPEKPDMEKGNEA